MTTKLKKGDKYNMLTIEMWEPTKKAWLCICACGNKTFARTWSLKTGKHKSCGCLNRLPRPHRQLPNNLGPKRGLYRLYKKAAIKRNYSFEITEKQFFDLIEKNCFYCGQKPKMVLNYCKYAKRRNFKHNGVDRVDNSKGYEIDNCVSCCEICNNSKASLDVDEWKLWIEKVYKKMFNDQSKDVPSSEGKWEAS